MEKFAMGNSNIESFVIENMRKLSNPEKVADILKKEQKNWDGTDLGSGWTGICLLLAELDNLYPGEGWDQIGHSYLIAIYRELEKRRIDSISLWGGLTGICLAVFALSKNKTRYIKLLNELHNALIAMLPKRIDQAVDNLQRGVSVFDYDVIQGLSGICRYLLLNHDVPEFRTLLLEILSYLVLLSEDKMANNSIIPGWYIPTENQILQQEKNQYPKGNFNMGMSHGIAGPLSILSLCMSQGIIVNDHEKAINRLTSWILKWKRKDDFGIVWPRRVSYDEYINGDLDNEPVFTESWCYGELGIARSLWLAGEAMNEQQWKDTALEAFIGMSNRARNNRINVFSPTYCHGFAGTLHMTKIMLEAAPLPELIFFRNHFRELILQQLDVDSAFGIRRCEHPGLLNGAAGVMLVLLRELKPISSIWECAFLLK